MMPETIERFLASKVAHAEEKGEEEAHAFPLPFLYFVLGYCLVLGVDKVVFGQSEEVDCCSDTVKQLSIDLRNSITALPEPSDTEDTCNCDVNQIHLIRTQMAKLTVAISKANENGEEPIELLVR
jgi:zinc transporter ZupT